MTNGAVISVLPSANASLVIYGHIMTDVAEWWSIEVFHSELQAASRWNDA
jgi:hypothetical protein